MGSKEEMVQVSCSLSKSHVFLLPELMKVITTASSSTYSWDSMKVCVQSDNDSLDDTRVILNLTKSRTSDEELIQGKFHRCCETVCKHGSMSDDIIGHVKITIFASRTLGEFLTNLSEDDEEDIKGTGWLEKVVSNEMFYPCWYDKLRRKSLHLTSNERIHKRMSSSRTSIILNNVDVFPLFQCSKSAGDVDRNQSYWTNQFGFNSNSNRRIIMPENECYKLLPEENRSNANLMNVEMKRNIRSLKERIQMTALPNGGNIFSNYYRSDENFVKFVNSRLDVKECPYLAHNNEAFLEKYDLFKNNNRAIKKARTTKPVIKHSPKSLNTLIKKRKRILGSYSADHLRHSSPINSEHIDSSSAQDCRDPKWIKSILKNKSKVDESVNIDKNLEKAESKRVAEATNFRDRGDNGNLKVKQSHNQELDNHLTNTKKACFRIEFKGNSFNPLKVLTPSKWERNKKVKNKMNPLSDAMADFENTSSEQQELAKQNEIRSLQASDEKSKVNGYGGKGAGKSIKDDGEHGRTASTRKSKLPNSGSVTNNIKLGGNLKKTNKHMNKIEEKSGKVVNKKHSRDMNIQKPNAMKSLTNYTDNYGTALTENLESEGSAGWKSTTEPSHKQEHILESIINPLQGKEGESVPKSQAEKNDISFMELLSIMTDEVKMFGQRLKTKK